MSSHPQDLDAPFQALLVALGGEDEQRMLEAIRGYFEPVRSSPGALERQFERIPILLDNGSSRLAAIRNSGLGAVDFEEAHAAFWSQMSELAALPDFTQGAAGRPLGASFEKLQVRMLHFLHNRRQPLFEHLLGFLETAAARLPAPRPGGLDRFLELLPRLAPRDDPAPWSCRPAPERHLPRKPVEPEELAGLSRPVRLQLARHLRSERLAEALFDALGRDPRRETVEHIWRTYLDNVREKFGIADPYSFADRFGLVGLVPPSGSLTLPAVVVWFVERGRHRSLIVEKLKGSYVHVAASVDGDGRSLRVLDFNSGQALDGLQLVLDDELVERMRTGLEASGGRFLVALVRANEPTVRRLWLQTGSIDFSGKLCGAMAAGQAGRESECVALLEQLRDEQPGLGEVHYQLALRKRQPGTPAAHAEARRLLLRELEVNPDGARALASLAITSKREQDFATALELFRQSLRRQPNSIDTLVSYITTMLSDDPGAHVREVIDAVVHTWDLDPDRKETRDLLEQIHKLVGVDLLKCCLAGNLDESLH